MVFALADVGPFWMTAAERDQEGHLTGKNTREVPLSMSDQDLWAKGVPAAEEELDVIA
jgi:hypothetical protein